MGNLEKTGDELKRNNPPPVKNEGSGELKPPHTGAELSISSHDKSTNMSDHNNREKAIIRQNISFNEVKDAYAEQAITFSANNAVEDIESPIITREFERINMIEGRLTEAIDHLDAIENKYGTIKVNTKVREYMEDDKGDLYRIRANGKVSKHKTTLKDKDKEDHEEYKDEESLRKKDLRGRISAHSYKRQVYMDDEGKELKRVRIEDTKIDRDTKKDELLRKSRKLDRKERELTRIQKSGRLLFHGSNIVSNARRSL